MRLFGKLVLETKKRLKRIQKFLIQSDLPARPARLAKILGVAPSSLTQWLGGEEAKGNLPDRPSFGVILLWIRPKAIQSINRPADPAPG